MIAASGSNHDATIRSLYAQKQRRQTIKFQTESSLRLLYRSFVLINVSSGK